MKEIKYRAWIKSLGVIADVLVIDFQDETVLLKGYKRDTIASFDQVVLMQYTGLKDVNGVEIYEEDIVKIGTGLYTVVWSNVKYGLELKRNPIIFNLHPGPRKKKTIEVIGNTKENPELLGVD